MLLIFFTVSVTTVHQKYFIFKWFSLGAMTIYKNFLIQCLSALDKVISQAKFVDDSYLPTDSQLQLQKTVDTVVGLPCKWVI